MVTKFSLLLQVAACFLAAAADQPQWGQAWSRNLISGEVGLLASFDPATGKNVRWVAEVGNETHGTPIVARGRVYIGTNNGRPRDPRYQGDRGVLMCFEEKSGEFLWQLVVPKLTGDIYLDWPNSGICSPPTVEGDRVYVVNNRGEVMCLDAHGMANGNQGPFVKESQVYGPGDTNSTAAVSNSHPKEADVLWNFDMASGAGIYTHDGAHSSVLILGDCLYLNTGTGVDNTHRRIRTPDAPSLIVLEKHTGRLVAREKEGIAPNIFHSTWSAPSLGHAGEKPAIFFCGGNGILYAFEALGTPAEFEKQNPGGTRPFPLRKFWEFDFDPLSPKTNVHKYISNRRESPSNVFGMPVVVSNRVYVAGGGDIWWGKNEAWLKCVDTSEPGFGRLAWSYPLEKHVMGTPAVSDGLVYIADTGKQFHCVDANTGAACWTHELQGEAWASPLAADGKVYLGTRRGTFYVFRQGRDKEVLSTVDLGSAISATVTAANKTLFVATMSKLYAIGEKAP